MKLSFEYGFCKINEIQVTAEPDGKNSKMPRRVTVQGRPVEATKRFWQSLHRRFGFTENFFAWFSPVEVFERISKVSSNDEVRWCIERDWKGTEKLLGVSNPGMSIVSHESLSQLLEQHDAEQVTYSHGVVTSRHLIRNAAEFKIAGDGFENRYLLDTPIDGFGKPAIYLSLLRLMCANGAVGYSPAFRSELSLGRGKNRGEFAIERALEGFNNEEGFAALRQRFESASNSWASMNEAQTLFRLLVKSHNTGQVAFKMFGSDGASLLGSKPDILRSFRQTVGDFGEIYGLANPDSLSQKRQRTLPAKCRVYELLNFASEVATHHLQPLGQRQVQAFIGDLVSREYDLEGTCDKFGDWKDFMIGDQSTTKTLASLHRR
ncbi:MAG: DUF932 domain-containing protein [Planctomycetes bacterium]|nr:DUF932 domain-containing protein [Planctomycetota bacterium]